VRALCLPACTGRLTRRLNAQAEFLQAADLEEAVKRRVALLDEAWFHTASTYLTLARRDGQQLVEAQLTTVLRAAADAKDATLRPEIRLLNALMRVATAAEREVLYERHSDFLVRHAVCTRACCARAQLRD